jgi:hypothetical protein
LFGAFHHILWWQRFGKGGLAVGEVIWYYDIGINHKMLCPLSKWIVYFTSTQNIRSPVGTFHSSYSTWTTLLLVKSYAIRMPRVLLNERFRSCQQWVKTETEYDRRNFRGSNTSEPPLLVWSGLATLDLLFRVAGLTTLLEMEHDPDSSF